MRSQRNVRDSRVLARERPGGFAVSNEVKLQQPILGGDHLFVLQRRRLIGSGLDQRICFRYAADAALAACLVPSQAFPSRHCIRRGAQPGCTGPDDTELAAPPIGGLLAPQISRAGRWIARANEKASAQGRRARAP